jgi:hypothetical protein
VEEEGVSHPNSVGSGSETDGSDVIAETELVWATRESERTERSSRGRPDVRALVVQNYKRCCYLPAVAHDGQ